MPLYNKPIITAKHKLKHLNVSNWLIGKLDELAVVHEIWIKQPVSVLVVVLDWIRNKGTIETYYTPAPTCSIFFLCKKLATQWPVSKAISGYFNIQYVAKIFVDHWPSHPYVDLPQTVATKLEAYNFIGYLLCSTITTFIYSNQGQTCSLTIHLYTNLGP